MSEANSATAALIAWAAFFGWWLRVLVEDYSRAVAPLTRYR